MHMKNVRYKYAQSVFALWTLTVSCIWQGTLKREELEICKIVKKDIAYYLRSTAHQILLVALRPHIPLDKQF